MNPHYIKRWKQSEPEFKNLAIGAVLMAPGVIALSGGASLAYQQQDILDECTNRPVASALPAEFCEASKSDTDNGIAIAAYGGVEMLVVGGAMTANHRRISSGRRNGRGNSPMGSSGPNPPAGEQGLEHPFRPNIFR